MRLRLLVRRHNLPDAAVLWSVEEGENPTISQLLDQVNEVIPLESAGDWGLEDYAVEIGGSGRNFECLHFHLVRNILHEDDEILIRPLLSHDLKLRKASGRHQISSDGRHLFDGWVFGRPRPHGPVERPAIEIPPRKRRRIMYLEESDSSFDESPFAVEGHTQLGIDSDGNRQLILSADFEDEEEDDDEDFEPDEDSEEDVEEGEEEEGGRQHLNGDINSLHDLAAMDSFEDEPDSEHMAGNNQKGSMSNLLRLSDEFPQVPRLVCNNVLVSCNDDISQARETLLQAFKRSTSRKPMVQSVLGQVPQRTINTRSKTKLPSKYTEFSLVSENTQNVNDDDGNQPPHAEDTLLLQYYDHHGLPEGSIKTGKALSHTAKIVSSSSTGLSDKGSRRASRTKVASVINRNTRTVRFSEDVSRGDAPPTSVQEDSDEPEDDDFDPESSIVEPNISSDSSSAESSDDEETNKQFPDETSSSEGDSSSDSETTSESDSDSDSDAEPDEISSKATVLQADAAPEGHSTTESPKEQKTLQNVLVPPGQGKNSTRNRNRRRRMANLLQRYKNKGILPAGTTVKELEQFRLDRFGKAENRTEKSGKLNGNDAANNTEFEIRRQMLLNSLATGGVEVGPQPLLKSTSPVSLGPMSEQIKMSDTIEAIASETPLNLSKSKGTNSMDDRNAEDDTESYAPDKVSGLVKNLGQSPTVDAEPTMAEEAPRPRRKIDLGAAGRLLFGALGVRAPKNKADHEKVRNELVKDIRRSKPSTIVQEATAETDSSNIDEGPEAWREVINLRAVECCYEGIELSPAPFPFVQRWDPQQQGSYFKQGSRGGKGKKNQRNQHQYYEDGQQLSNKRKRHESSYDTYQDSYNQYAIADFADVADTGAHIEGGEFISSTSNTQEVCADGIEGAVDEQIMRDVQEAATSQNIDEDDLPRLPEDISTLPNLSDEAIKPGMVIAFKQLILSEATKWQPQMSNYRTAVLIKASGSGNLELRLAKRDREQTEKYYDEETGERIYGKFDMPNEDDQDEDEEDGFLEVTIDEIVEPKVVQLAPEGLDASTSLPNLHNNTTQPPGDNSISPINTDESELSKNLPSAPSGVSNMITGHQVIGASKDHFLTIRRDLSTGPDDIEALSVLENTRAVIPVSINTADFRTSIPSSVNAPCAQISSSTESTSQKGGYSPKFNGFNHISSQHAQVTSSSSHLDPTTPLTEHSYELSGTKNDRPHIKSATPKVHYPELSVPSSLVSQVSDRGHQPDYSIPGDDTLHQFDELDSFSGAQEELLLSTSEYAQASRSSNAEDKLPSNHSRSVSDDSSADLPTLAEVFSTARSSIGLKHEQKPLFPQKTEIKDAKKIQESYDKEMEALDAMLEAVEDSEHVILNESVEQGIAKSQIESGSQFSIPPGSQKVDLTLSSDGEMIAEDNHSDEPYDDTCSPLRESERVEGKTYKRRRQRNSSSRTPSQRVAKARNTRRKK